MLTSTLPADAPPNNQFFCSRYFLNPEYSAFPEPNSIALSIYLNASP